MATPRFALICDYATVSQDGKLIICGVFEKIWARAFPAQHGRLTLVASFDLPLGRHFVGSRVRGPSGYIPYNAPPLTMDVVQPGPSNVVMEFVQLPLNEPGKYQIEIHIDNALAATTLFEAGMLATAPPNKA